MKLHPSITEKKVIAACKRDDYSGFCVACGVSRKECEPDARNYLCPKCGKNMVFGAEELLMEF
jgi:predicted RNA-binding Zn-ribbon protein involved in translation (DUF1610 family)